MTGNDNDGWMWLCVALLVSTAAHSGFYMALPYLDIEPDEPQLVELDFEVLQEEEAEAEPEIPEPEPEPEIPEPEPPPPPEPVFRDPPPQEEEPPPPEEEPPPAEETPVAFDGLVLTNEGEGSWSVQQASGRDREGPIGRPGAQVTGRSRQGQRNGAAGARGDGPVGPRIVPASDLRREPGQPSNVNAILQRNYPREAREQGIEGVARLRLRVLADGTIRVLGVRSESWQGFAAACRRTLQQAGRWRPPLGPSGNPVATDINYSCTFEVRY